MGALHEDRQQVSEDVLDMKRAIDSLREELEAVDWYNQRQDVTKDENLREILIHNMNEEKEYAAMLLEWIRTHDEAFRGELEEFLFKDRELVGI
jgi:hypothetical protein